MATRKETTRSPPLQLVGQRSIYHKRIPKQSSGMAYFTAPVLQEKDEFCLGGELLACLNIAHLALL